MNSFVLLLLSLLLWMVVAACISDTLAAAAPATGAAAAAATTTTTMTTTRSNSYHYQDNIRKPAVAAAPPKQLQQQHRQHRRQQQEQETTTMPPKTTTDVIQAGDFEQINTILSGATIQLPTSTVPIGSISDSGDNSSCGPLDFIDLNLQFDATDLANDALNNQEFDIPSDVLSLRQRRRQLQRLVLQELQSQQQESNTPPPRHRHSYDRLLKNSCPAPGSTTSGVDGTLNTADLLNLIQLDLDLNFGKEVNELLQDEVFKIPKTKIKFDDLASTLGGRRQRERDLQFQNVVMHHLTRRLQRYLAASTSNGDFMSVLAEISGTANAAEQLSIVWGDELSDFINQFDFSLDEFTQTETIEILGATFELDLKVQDVYCNNFQVERVAVGIDNNSDDFSNINVILATSITKLQGDCTGFVSYGIGGLNAQLSFDATVGAKSLNLDVTFAGGALTVNSCSSEIRVLGLTVSDVRILFINVSDEIANAVLARVEDLIFGFVEDAANDRTYYWD